jgi:hypothetical protein
MTAVLFYDLIIRASVLRCQLNELIAICGPRFASLLGHNHAWRLGQWRGLPMTTGRLGPEIPAAPETLTGEVAPFMMIPGALLLRVVQVIRDVVCLVDHPVGACQGTGGWNADPDHPSGRSPW